MLALAGASIVGCVDGEKGARPTSSASYSDGDDDSGVFDPLDTTTGGETSAGVTGDSGPVTTQGGGSDSTTTGTPGSSTEEDSGSEGPTSGPSSGSGGTSGYGTTYGYASSGDYGTYGYASAEDDGWFLGLRAVECGDVPLRNCP